MRGHIGGHILLGHFPAYPDLCGYCGKNSCRVMLYISSGSGENSTWSVKSNCDYFYDFSLKPASNSTKNSPFTNRPIKCDICKPTLNIFQSYNMHIHYRQVHPLCSVQENANIGDLEKSRTVTLIKKQQIIFKIKKLTHYIQNSHI